MATKRPEPLFRTPDDQLNKVEQFKLASQGIRGELLKDFRDADTDDITDASEQLAKSHGIYLEYNRAKTGREKDWMYMIRVSVPGGGSFNAEQWRIMDEAAERYANANPYGTASLRLTTRQNIQFHWVKKHAVVPLIQDIASTGFFAMNGCGDNVRNVMGCPLSKFSDIYDAHAKAHEYGRYFQIPSAPHVQVFAIDPTYVRDMETGPKYDYGQKLLNRKFKIAFSAVHRDEANGGIVYDNCVELRTNDLGVAPIIENEEVIGYQVYVGGGQGEKNGKPTFAALGVPLGVFSEANLMHGLKSIVDVHKEWGDRKNRHWARLKYVINKQGVDWYRDQLREKGAAFDAPKPDFDPGPRMLHHGWTTLPSTGKLAYGAYIENGRLVDSDPDAVQDNRSGNVTGNGHLKAMVPAALEAFPGTEVMISPNQDLLFVNVEPDAKEAFEAKLAEFGYGKRRGKTYSTLRVLSGSCVGLPTCRLRYTDSEQFEPELIDELEEKGFGDVYESIGITGCERQCFRPGTKSIGWVGQGPDMYGLKLGGSEDGRHQGTWVVVDDQWHLRRVPREDVSKVTAALLEWHNENRENGENFGALARRMGNAAVVAYLRSRPELEHLFEKSYPAPFIPGEEPVETG